MDVQGILEPGYLLQLVKSSSNERRALIFIITIRYTFLAISCLSFVLVEQEDECCEVGHVDGVVFIHVTLLQGVYGKAEEDFGEGGHVVLVDGAVAIYVTLEAQLLAIGGVRAIKFEVHEVIF